LNWPALAEHFTKDQGVHRLRRQVQGKKVESQIFLDCHFHALRHAGTIELGGIMECRIRWKDTTKFADLVWLA
jgi:hypothetical protein